MNTYPENPETVTPSHLSWRLVCDGEHSALWNMAVDAAILDAVIARIAPPTLRLYRFEEAAITVGRFQNVLRTINLAVCRDLGLSVVRRPTGGRGVLHGGDQTVSVIVPAANLGSGGHSVIGSYRLLSQGFVLACKQLDMHVTFGQCISCEGRGGDCFTAVSRADLLTTGDQKLVGSAQRRREGVILQQSSLRHRGMEVTGGQVFLGQTAPESYPLAAHGYETLQAALMRGFTEALDLSLNLGAITGWEEERACAIMAGLSDLTVK